MTPNRGSNSQETIELTRQQNDVSQNRNASRDDTAEICRESRQLIGYRGKWYDVSQFMDKHPGGDVIRHFVGRDATHVMDGMHKFNVVKSRKAVGSYKYAADPFGEDMNQLEMMLRSKGYYDNSFRWCLGKCLQALSLLGLLAWFILSGRANENALGRIVCGAMMALFWQQTGMLMHDYMHSQLTRKRKLDERVGVFFGTFCFGVSARWWKDEHIVHHSLTNTVDSATGFIDPQADEETWAQNEKIFPFRRGKLHRALVKIQHLTFLPLCICVGRFGIIVDSMRLERRLDVWVAWLLHWVWVSYLFSHFTSWTTVFIVYGMGCLGEGILHIQLLLNHYSKRFFDMQEKLTMDHYRAMIECNLNITCPWWMDWFHGGLNFHHEHHCFPRLPRNRLREVSSFIREICRKHDVQYDEMPFFEALGKTMRNLYRVRNQFLILKSV